MVLAGLKGDTWAACQDLICRLSIQDSVCCPGYIEDISGLLKAADIFIYSSFSEGSSNAVVEAALAGLPIVATNIPGIASCLPVENHQYLFAPNNVNQFTDKLSQLIMSPCLRKKIGESNMMYAKKEFLIDKMIDSYSELILSICPNFKNLRN